MTFLTSAVDGGELPTACFCLFTPGKEPRTDWIAVYVGPIATLDGFGEEIISCFSRDSNPRPGIPERVVIPNTQYQLPNRRSVRFAKINYYVYEL